MLPRTGSSEVRKPLVDAEQLVPDHAMPARLPTGSQSRMRMPDLVLAAGAVLAVFFVHFRPWQGGLLEEWGLAQAWNSEGFGGYAASMPVTVGRPFALL